ncbi:hypothetical protein OUZ56_012056 [Daphnia magna]|uniref:Uncharacterized protein n=1 Tax=Daphnia magna TaxID=35525 RepID=A0ABQ9Z1X1_9CRUS|nr:hypothetical protein OUZ56_012056 [Daphnia magna]
MLKHNEDQQFTNADQANLGKSSRFKQFYYYFASFTQLTQLILTTRPSVTVTMKRSEESWTSNHPITAAMNKPKRNTYQGYKLLTR